MKKYFPVGIFILFVFNTLLVITTIIITFANIAKTQIAIEQLNSEVAQLQNSQTNSTDTFLTPTQASEKPTSVSPQSIPKDYHKEKEIIFETDQKNSLEVFQQIKDKIPFPLMYFDDSKIKGDIIYSYIDFSGRDRLEDIDFFSIENFSFLVGNFKINSMQGAIPWGGICDESFKIKTSQGDMYVCRNDNHYTVSQSRNINFENPNREEIDYFFFIEGEYTKTELENIFSILKITEDLN